MMIANKTQQGIGQFKRNYQGGHIGEALKR